MTKILNPARLAKLSARKVLDTLEDITSVGPGKTGAVRWINVETSSWVSGRDSCAATRGGDALRWYEEDSIGLAGVCHVEKAHVCMLKLNTASQRPLTRRAAVRVHSFRRVEYPGSPYLFSRRIRAIFHKGGQLQKNGVHVKGRVALLGNEVSDAYNYYHFWMDTVGDLLMLRDTLPSHLQPDRFLISHAGQTWQDEILEQVGIAPAQVIRYADHERLTADELIVPVRDKGEARVSPGLVDRIRRSVNLPPVAQGAGRLLYISRGDSARRTVRNEADVRDLVQHYGIEVLELSGMSVSEQIDLFASARLVVGTHGAGLTNLMWCQPGTTVVELLPDRHRVPCFYRICEQRNLNHHVIPCSQPGTEKGLTAPMLVPLEPLAAALERELLARKAPPHHGT
ncbi:DUF563 domain-containing protein [Thioalkalivibrio sp. ALE9]|uniref:glycosyltransferase family 61 protein n=1 Tax=Thioalkalivibrio sp. ALE9 TaxID=1158169 RepID=UPI001E46C7C2|nr:glycosyltransferase family 61 protein [Thioalkalivibrio sp. ALE9]